MRLFTLRMCCVCVSETCRPRRINKNSRYKYIYKRVDGRNFKKHVSLVYGFCARAVCIYCKKHLASTRALFLYIFLSSVVNKLSLCVKLIFLLFNVFRLPQCTFVVRAFEFGHHRRAVPRIIAVLDHFQYASRIQMNRVIQIRCLDRNLRRKITVVIMII